MTSTLRKRDLRRCCAEWSSRDEDFLRGMSHATASCGSPVGHAPISGQPGMAVPPTLRNAKRDSSLRNSQRWCRGPHCAGRRFRPAKPSGTQKTRRRENGRKRQEKAAGLKPGATKFGGSRGQPGMGVPPAAKRRARSVVPHKKDAGLKPGATRLGDSGQPGMAVPRAAKQRARSVVPSRKMLG